MTLDVKFTLFLIGSQCIAKHGASSVVDSFKAPGWFTSGVAIVFFFVRIFNFTVGLILDDVFAFTMTCTVAGFLNDFGLFAGGVAIIALTFSFNFTTRRIGRGSLIELGRDWGSALCNIKTDYCHGILDDAHGSLEHSLSIVLLMRLKLEPICGTAHFWPVTFTGLWMMFVWFSLQARVLAPTP